MIEKLIEIMKEWGVLLSPLLIVHPWESAAVLRRGKYHRTKECGWWPKWPLFEDSISAETCVTTMRLPPQSLTTKDDTTIVVSTIVKYQIVDMKAYVCDIWDQKDVLGDVTMGAVAVEVKNHSYEELMKGDPAKDIIDEVRKEVNKYGFKILKITFIDLCKAKSLRLIQAAGKDLDN